MDMVDIDILYPPVSSNRAVKWTIEIGDFPIEIPISNGIHWNTLRKSIPWQLERLGLFPDKDDAAWIWCDVMM